jgi:hypothetical protein
VKRKYQKSRLQHYRLRENCGNSKRIGIKNVRTRDMPEEEWINFTFRKDVIVQFICISAHITRWYTVLYEHFGLVELICPLILILRHFVIKYLLHHISLFSLHTSFFNLSISKFNIFTVVVVICYLRDLTF